MNSTVRRMQFVLRRSAAYLLDMLILALGVQVTQWSIWLVSNGALHRSLHSGWQMEAWLLLTVSLPCWLYFALSESSRFQATLAKRWLGLQVMNRQHQRLSFTQALWRTILNVLPWELTHVTLLLPTPIWYDAEPNFRLGIGVVYALLTLYIIPIFYTDRHQSLPDILSGTEVYYAYGSQH